MTIEIIRAPITWAHLSSLAEAQFGDMVKGVVDVERRVLAVGGELHSDEEPALIDDGSAQANLWGINLFPAEPGDGWIAFDSLINVRPAQGNRSRNVDDPDLQNRIRQVVAALVQREK